MAGTFQLETAKGGVEVTIGTPFPRARGLWVGSAGDVNVRFSNGGSAVYFNVQGQLNVECVEVLASGTTASNITTLV